MQYVYLKYKLLSITRLLLIRTVNGWKTKLSGVRASLAHLEAQMPILEVFFLKRRGVSTVLLRNWLYSPVNAWGSQLTHSCALGRKRLQIWNLKVQIEEGQKTGPEILLSYNVLIIGPGPLEMSSTAKAYSKSELRLIHWRYLPSWEMQQEDLTPSARKAIVNLTRKPFLASFLHSDLR